MCLALRFVVCHLIWLGYPDARGALQRVARLPRLLLPIVLRRCALENAVWVRCLNKESGTHVPRSPFVSSQRSVHDASIFRLLLKVAVNGTHQCDFLNFCGGLGSQQCKAARNACGKLLAQVLLPRLTTMVIRDMSLCRARVLIPSLRKGQ